MARDDEVGRARELGRGRDRVRLERGKGRHRLPRRARRVDAVGRAVQRRVVHRLRGRAREAGRGEPLRRHSPRVDARVVRRVGRHREDRAVPGVERNDRAARRLPLVVLQREVDPVADRLLGSALERQVEREADRLARLRRTHRHEVAALVPERVHGELLEPSLAAQVAVVGGLEAGLADRVAGLVAVPVQLLELPGRDLRDVAQELRGDRAVVVAPQERRHDADSRELPLVLLQIEDRRVAVDRLTHRHRRDRVVGAPLDVDEHLTHGDAQHVRELPQLGEPGRPGLRQVGRRELHGRPPDVRDERVAVAIEDLSTHRRNPDRAHLVVERRVEVLRPREHLQRPEPEEEDPEGDQGYGTEDPEPQRKLRREAVRPLDPRVGREEAVRAGTAVARAAASQGAAPPSRPRAQWRARAPGA